jgi:tetratricopeptide (TPR) repeat protein
VTRENLAALAEARLVLEHFEDAEQLAHRNLAENAPPRSRDWLLLGDALSKQGRATEAQDAYAKALTYLRQTIRSRTPLSAQRSIH